MNKNYRLVFSRVRNMLVAAEESATACGKRGSGEAAVAATVLMLGGAPLLAHAQIVPSGAHAPGVISTANGLPQVNVNRPSGAGVSMNTYSQFDVQQRGAILNNSPTITGTQLGGQINGNPNYASGQAARIIVNQVNSANPSQLNGFLEVAGQRATVVLANPSGISVNGGGFINTSRAVLTTGVPLLDASGALTGYNVTGGNITVQGAGFNASNVDQVDLIARAVRVNAAIYANSLNVVAGANSVNHDTLAATPIAGDGVPSPVSIDVSQLGGMYAGKILLASNEHGVGVSNEGVIAAQAGDFTLNADGRITLSGKTTASGNVILNSNTGITNNGTTYAQQSLSANTTGDLTNSGTLAAQGAVSAQATGALVNDHGALTGGAVTLNAGRLSNQGGNVLAQGTLNATAAGDVSNQGGVFVSQGAMQVSGAAIDNSKGEIDGTAVAISTPGDLVNEGGTITQTASGPMTIAVSGTLDNSAGGTLQTNSTDLTLAPGALGNDGGTITLAGTGTLTVNAGKGAGSISNAGGTIASNGKIVAQGGAFNNAAGSVIAQTGLVATVGGALNNTNGKLLSNTDLSVTSGTLTNNGGQIGAGANATIHTGSMTNDGGSVVAPNLTISTGSTLDNSSGDIEANELVLSATDLVNHGGTITQYGAALMGLDVSGTFDNSAGGTLQTNSTDFALAPWALNNNDGSILHAGTGTFTIAPGSGAGALSNAGGRIITAGQLLANAGSFDNTSGVFAAQGSLSATIAGVVNNTQGVVRSLSSVSLASGGALTNTNGQIQSGTGAAGDASTLAVQAASIDNTGGLVGNLGRGDTSVQGGSQLVNSGGQVTGNGNVAVNVSSTLNTRGGQVSGANVAVKGDTLDNTSGAIGNVAGVNGDVTVTIAGAISNTNGQMGATRDLSVSAATLTGGGAYSAANDVAISVQGDFAPTPDVQFNAGHDLTFTLPGTFTNAALLEAANNLGINAGDIANSGTMMAGGTLATHSNTLENTGVIVGGSVSLTAKSTVSNVGPTALIGATDSNGMLELLAADIENRDDTTATDTQATTAIYGLGKVVLAGGKDASGNYTNAALIRNRSALIESAGDMELHADQVTNTRRVVTTTGFNQPVDPALLAQLGISLSGRTGQVNTPDPNNIGGVYIDPPHGGQMNSDYMYTTYTGVAVANLIAGISPQAQIVSGGKLDASSVGAFQNYWSAVAAAGDIAAPVALDQNSWQGQTAPGVQVTYSGLYHYRNYDGSIPDWTYSFCASGCKAPADIRNYALPSYESSFVAGGTLSGTGISIDNTAGNAGIPSPGLAGGQALSGVSVNGITGSAVNGGSGMVNPVIASATAVNVLANLTIPQGGLFGPVSTPGASYLIETNPAFTSQKTFISSDYYLQQLGLNPQTTAKRLGDGFYEQQLVRNQITSLTGKAVLGPYTDLQSMYESLLAAGASLSKSLDLPLGMSLSPEQVAQLTGNVIIMQTQVVDGQSVLVPVVYLAKASQQNMNGPLVAATDIDLKNAQTFTNSGTVQAANSLAIDGKSIDNAFGALQSGGVMSLTTAGDVDLTSAKVNAGSLALIAGGNLILDTATKTLNQVSATGATRTTTTLGPVASLNVAGDAAIVTGGNFEQHAGNLSVGGNLGMAVGGNYDIGTVQTGEHKVVERANGVSNTNINSVTGSTVNVGGVSVIGVGGNLTATGASIALGGGGTLAAKGDVTFQAAKATSTIDSNSSGSDSHGSYSESIHKSSDTLTATTLNSGNSLTVASGKDINVTGSAINLDKGTAALVATGNVNIGAATETHVENSQEQHSHSNVVSGKEVASSRDTTITLAQGSTISADGVSIASGKDINVAGSTIVGTNDVLLNAAHDVNITTTQNTLQSSGSYQEKVSGLGTSGLTVTAGTSKLATTDQESSLTNNASTVGSINGNLAIQAGNTLHVTGSDLVAGGNVTGVAANVIIDAATDIAHRAQTQKTSSSGVTIGLAGSVGDAINNAYAQGQAVGHSAESGNDRAAALHAIAAGGDALMAGMGAKSLMGGATGPNAPSIGVQVSMGSSRSQSQSSEEQTMQRGSNVSAGGTAAFVATGDGAPGSGNVTIAGSNVSANDVLLAAKNQVNIQNTTDTDSTRSSDSSSSASVGVSIGTNGYGISAAMSNAHGDANSDVVIQNASHVTGNNSVTVISGGDTNVIGSQINGGQVIADVGGNLNVTSVQDVTKSAAHQSSAGGGFSISTTGGSASVTAQYGHADGDYAQVNEQAGINAGSGGFDINVKGNTALSGAVITSTAEAEKNSLTTGTLTFSDIENKSHYSANSIGGSYGLSGSATQDKAVGPASVPGAGGLVPMIAQNESGDQSATTRSAVSAGTINITNQAAQMQDVASLSRDATDTNGKVGATPDVNNILNQQADTMQAAQAAGQVVAQGIGQYADSKRDTAIENAKAAEERGDTQAAQRYWSEAKSWSDDGSNRLALHVAGGGLIGGLGGGGIGSAAMGAAGAGVASYLAGQTRQIADSVGGETGSELAGKVAANVLVTLGGGLVGGTAGAASASNVNLYNQWKDKSGAYADEQIAQALGESGRKSASPFELVLMSIANGLNAIVGMGGGKPPTASPGAVLVDSAVGQAAGAGISSGSSVAGYGAGNATLSNGNNDGSKGSVAAEPKIDVKIGDQLADRGWSKNDIQAVINNGATGTSIDKRSAAKSPDGIARNDSATVYGSPGGYVVVNDRTGEVVQISNKNDPAWIVDGRIQWNDVKGK